ncbi:unnamed protein product, partial [Ectocarpus fasciculatus]
IPLPTTERSGERCAAPGPPGSSLSLHAKILHERILNLLGLHHNIRSSSKGVHVAGAPCDGACTGVLRTWRSWVYRVHR